MLKDALGRRRDLLALAGLALILALGGYLRLANNGDTPGWYTDEGTHLAIAQRLAEGQVGYLAINQSTFLFAKLPLFELLLAVWLKLGDGGMGSLRSLTGLLGLVSVATLYGVVRWGVKDIPLALTAALLLAIYPQAVLYSRFGFSYNLLAPLLLLVLPGLWQYLETAPAETGRRRAWLAFTALIIGLGGISDLWMFTLAAPLLLAALARRWTDALWSLPLVCLPFGIYAALMLLSAPEAFLFDLRFTAGRLSGLSPAEQLVKLATNYTVLVTHEPWPALALVGLALLRPLRLQLAAWLLLAAPVVLLGRTEALYHLSFYYMIPLLPLISLGLAALLRRGIPYAAARLRRGLAELFEPGLPAPLLAVAAYALVLALATMPLATTTVNLMQQTRTGFTTAIDPFLIEPRPARQIAAFVNRQTTPDDLVIASPGLAWLLEANAADFQMAVAYTGQATPHLPANLPPERFAFRPDYTQARFVIVDNLWHTWAAFNVGGVPQMLQTVQGWRISFQQGNITVYCNPTQPDC